MGLGWGVSDMTETPTEMPSTDKNETEALRNRLGAVIDTAAEVVQEHPASDSTTALLLAQIALNQIAQMQKQDTISQQLLWIYSDMPEN